MSVLIMIAISIALALVAYMLMPKPKQPKPAAATDLESPTAEAGRPVPVAFGTITIKGLNILGYLDKQVREYKVKA
jgi:predicted phage tail protein